MKKHTENAEEILIRSIFPGHVHLVGNYGDVYYLVLDDDGKLDNLETHEVDEMVYRPKQDLPFELPNLGVMLEPQDIDPAALFREVEGFIRDHVVLPREGDYLIVTLWIFHTYVIEKFESTPYLYLHGIHHSGKTRSGMIMIKLAYRGTPLVSPTEAVLFRITEHYEPTLLLDEIELTGRGSKQGIVHLIKTRYKRGIPVIRTNMDNGLQGEERLESFDTFGPLIMCTSGYVPADIEDRSLVFLMQRSESEIVDRKADPDKIIELRNRLTIWRANMMNRDLPEVKPITRWRLWEIVEPLCQVLKVVDPDREEEFTQYVQAIHEEREASERQSLEAEIVRAIYEACELTGELTVTTDDITNRILRNRGNDQDKLSNYVVGRRIARLGYHNSRSSKQRGYIIDLDLLEQHKKEYGITEADLNSDIVNLHPDSYKEV
ncbi:hypothetical protein ACFL6P_06470 [Candidatus Latescibacterota bacterium]